MERKKYIVSKEAAEELTQRLMKAAKNQSAPTEGLLKAQILPEFVKRMTKVKDEEDIIKRNAHLSQVFQGFLNLYGFESLHDMYLYSLSCKAEMENIYKAKDYSKLVPVKRKIMRNGKETEVTVYENPNKDKKDDEDKPASQGNTRRSYGHARELKGKMHGKDEITSTKKLAQLKLTSQSLKQGTKFKADSDYFFELTSEEGHILAIIGYSEIGDYFIMDFYVSTGEVAGVAARGFSELVRLAVQEHKGVKAKDDPKARPVFAKFGLTQEGNVWSIESADLQAVFGESVHDSN
jgi:hypothetical protein